MQLHEVEQGTPEWHQVRLGIPTASCFDKIITPTGKPSTQAAAYENKVIAEILTGKSADTFEGNVWTERGKELEPDAVDFYEMQTGLDTRIIGFVTNDENTFGCSPDRLVGENGLLEIKCPAPHTHVQYLIDKEIDKGYYPQVQGQLFVTGREWCDWLSYHPEMPPVIIRVERDIEFIETLEKLLEKFTKNVSAKLKKIGHAQ